MTVCKFTNSELNKFNQIINGKLREKTCSDNKQVTNACKLRRTMEKENQNPWEKNIREKILSCLLHGEVTQNMNASNIAETDVERYKCSCQWSCVSDEWVRESKEIWWGKKQLNIGIRNAGFEIVGLEMLDLK